MKNNKRNIEVSKDTGDKFTISKTIWEAENRKKITNDEYMLILIGEVPMTINNKRPCEHCGQPTDRIVTHVEGAGYPCCRSCQKSLGVWET